MCNCINLVNEVLKEKNACLVSTISFSANPSRVGLMIEKYDPKKRGRLPTVAANYCPFCGEKYQAVEHSLHPTSETLPAQEALSTPEHSATSQS